jgi:signal transduction histidine kinase
MLTLAAIKARRAGTAANVARANVIRHAETSWCEVLIEQHTEHLSIEIADAGHDCGTANNTASGAGRGLAGMRERVALLRGKFTAGSRPDGGFRVTARLPVPAQAQTA